MAFFPVEVYYSEVKWVILEPLESPKSPPKVILAVAENCPSDPCLYPPILSERFAASNLWSN